LDYGDIEDAEEEPSPLIVLSGEEWKWENVKSFVTIQLPIYADYH